MCGIAGVVGFNDRVIAEGAVRTMVRTLARRGPDGEGIENWERAVLGHRRLAIFDLSEAGKQPMVSPDNSLGVVFNGAIYNYLELTEELLEKGYSFKSKTDTEILIHGYWEWGLDRLVSKLKGMFAFGLWDNRTRKLSLVRDRLGVKPLVFVERNGGLAFASTVRALRVAGFVEDINEDAVGEFIEFGFISDEHSIYRGAVKVPPATIVEWTDGVLNKRQYWVPPTTWVSPTPSFREAVEEVERLFLRAVEVRLRADVPVGALLSGGIDSALVCWAVSKLGGDVKAFTIGTPNHSWDETVAARATAKKIGIEHQVLEMSEEDVTGVEELVEAYAEPFACASALGMLRVSRAVAPMAKVLLTGDGGDDVFLGYPRHRHLWLAEKLSRASPSVIKGWWLAARSAVPRIGSLRRVAALCDYVAGGLGAFISGSESIPMLKANGVLGDRLSGLTGSLHKLPWSIEAGSRVLEDFLDYERKTRFVGEYMTKVDGTTMHYALEARSPFLDQDLWAFSASLPFDLRLHGGKLKAILRELARRKISQHNAKGPKLGFGVPVQQWLAGNWRPLIETAFRESILDKEGWIHSKTALAQLDGVAQGGWAPPYLWYLFVFESWMRYEKKLRPQASIH